jgi:RNA polymerase sigma factor (sigma-70 family)
VNASAEELPMPADTRSLLRHLRRLTAAPQSEAPGDACLLERFVRCRDEGSFAALVGRHGPMVYGVCRRLLADAHDAEDCFQATFLVLARRAADVRPPGALAGWLYGVARRVALKAHSRRPLRPLSDESSVRPAAGCDPLDTLTARELLDVLDEELQRLPAAYRLPLIYCCLEGLSQEEAAQRLGWTPGSVKGRLERGRKLLHARLAKRGLTLSTALAAAEVARGTVGVPASLTAQAVRAALTEAEGAAPAAAAALAEAVLRGAAIGRLRVVPALLLVLGAVALGVGLPAQPPPGDNRPGEPSRAGENSGRKATQEPARTGVDLHGDPLPPGALARLGTIRWRHRHSTADLATVFSPDGKSVVTAGDGTLKRWDSATGKLLLRFPGNHWGGMLFSPNGRWLAAGRDLLDTDTGKVLRQFPSEGRPFALSPDGSLLAVGEADGSVTLRRTDTGEATQRLRGKDKQEYGGAFTPDGRSLVTLGEGLKACHWDVATGELRRTVALPVNRWRTFRLSPDGRTLAVSRAAEVSLWDTTTGEERGKLGEDAARARYGLSFSGDSRTLATDWYDEETREARICLWDVAGRKLLRRFSIPSRALGFLYFSPDNRTLASSGFNEPRLRLWDTATGRPLHQQAAHDGGITALAFTPDGRVILSGSDDGTLRVWDAETGRGVRELPGHPGGVTGVAVTPDGRAVLSGGFDARLLLQDWQTGKELRHLVLVPKDKLSPNVSYGPRLGLAADGRTAVAQIGTIDGGSLLHVWEPDTGRVPVRRAERSRVDLAAFSPDARILATYAESFKPATPPKNPKAKALKEGAVEVVGTHVVLQDVATGRPRLAIPLPDRNARRTVFSPDGRTLVTCGYRERTDEKGSHDDKYTLHMWELATGAERLTLRSPQNDFNFYFEDILFSPDGRTLAVAHKDRTIQVWDVATGAALLKYTGYEADVRCLAFRPDGKVLASGHSDSTILLWDLAGAAKRTHPNSPSTPKELEQGWADLASADARKAHAALWRMFAAPDRAVPFLAARLRPAAPVPADEIQKLLADLDSAQYERREAASRQLADFGEAAEPALEEALKPDPPVEKRRRVEQLLAVPRVVRIPEQLRALRAVEALERIGNAEARRVLEAMAKGAPEARLTREARASLDRLLRRTAATP